MVFDGFRYLEIGKFTSLKASVLPWVGNRMEL